MLTANGFRCARKRKHEIWLRHAKTGALEAKVILSHGNAEIRTRRLFSAILKQAKKTEGEFERVLKS